MNAVHDWGRFASVNHENPSIPFPVAQAIQGVIEGGACIAGIHFSDIWHPGHVQIGSVAVRARIRAGAPYARMHIVPEAH
jgi:hypothetical protein